MTQRQEELKLCERAQRADRRNQAFKTMTPARQRVTIAKDVLRWLDARKIIPGHMYVMLTEPGGNVENTDDVRRHDTVNGYDCHACGIGSLLACAVERGVVKSLMVEPWEGAARRMPKGADSIWEKLEGLYDKEQLVLIEAAYEGTTFTTLPGGTLGETLHAFKTLAPETQDACWAWRPKYPDDEERMRLIMKNIIRHKGTFVPADIG